MHCRVFNKNPGLPSLDASSSLLQVVTTKCLQIVQNVHWETKSNVVETHWLSRIELIQISKKVPGSRP